MLEENRGGKLIVKRRIRAYQEKLKVGLDAMVSWLSAHDEKGSGCTVSNEELYKVLAWS